MILIYENSFFRIRDREIRAAIMVLDGRHYSIKNANDEKIIKKYHF